VTSGSERGNGPSEADRILARLDALAELTDEPGRLTRLAFSPALKAANARVLGWMREAGMTAEVDAAGNLVGRYEGEAPGAPALMLGSHLDTVRDAGRFDGMLGVVTAIAVVERLARSGRRLPFAVEIVGFADEEGVRFGSTVLGSPAMAGLLPPDWTERRDFDGVSAGEALAAFGFDPAAIAAASRAADPPFAYLELHIEQGPVLESLGTALGCVTAIAGATRLAVAVTGLAGHAGTVPMSQRRDALAAAAECVLAVERLCTVPDIVGTVGHLRVHPDATNVIPGGADFSIDIRSQDDGLHRSTVDAVLAECRRIAARRNVELSSVVTSETAATPCSPRLIRAISGALEAQGGPVPMLASGAGHDGIAMSAITEIGMIFLRCAGGISHHPAENVTAADIERGLDALFDTVLRLEP
jgi:allantoate deiminase